MPRAKRINSKKSASLKSKTSQRARYVPVVNGTRNVFRCSKCLKAFIKEVSLWGHMRISCGNRRGHKHLLSNLMTYIDETESDEGTSFNNKVYYVK